MARPFEPDIVELSDEDFDRQAEVYGKLADSIRRLSTASIQTTVNLADIEALTVELNSIAEKLEADRIEGSYGVSITTTGRFRGYGNAVVGLRNPVAPPLQIHQDYEQGIATAEFELGPRYEGPPGMVHGGVAALVLDQLLGEAGSASGSPGMTGTLSLRYRRPTPLGRLSARAWSAGIEGYKNTIKGELYDADGNVTVEAEGLFILPRWAREAMEAQKHATPQFER